jgi:flagellar protein FlaG
MIENVTVNNDSLMINKGEGYMPSQPPSPSPSTSTAASPSRAATQKSDSGPAVQVEVNKEIADTISNSVTQKSSTETVTGNIKKGTSEREMEQRLKDTIQTLNDKLTRLDHEVQFKLDKRINKNYISVIDKKSKEVIREFPPEEIRAFIARFDEFNQKLTGTSDVKSLIINLEV